MSNNNAIRFPHEALTADVKDELNRAALYALNV